MVVLQVEWRADEQVAQLVECKAGEWMVVLLVGLKVDGQVEQLAE